jgi:hypothetical protein
MDAEHTLVYDPTAPAAAEPGTLRRPLDTLRGKVVGFIDNAKPNFNHLADELSARLTEGYGVAAVVRHRKASSAAGARAEALDRLAAECDLVIAGSGD